MLASLFVWSGAAMSQPHLERHGTATQLIVNGKPMLIIGGEMGNSSASTLADLQRYLPHLHGLGLNTVLVPVCWELIEPQEGQFDMTSVGNILSEARRNDLKVVVLWFGAWKNSMSCYAPEWFKRDTKRFPRAHALNGRPVEEASSLSANVLNADRRAFCHLMQYLKDNDSQEETVVMVQVENEIGMIDVPRDYSADADRLYKEWMAGKLTSLPTGSAGIESEERFQAWTYAVYAEQIAKAGKAIYNVPMYVNVALNSRNRKAGEYPSGGPLAHLADIWKTCAPSIDIMGLDLYDSDYRGWTDLYRMPNTLQPKLYNPLFIPEIRLDDNDAVRALYAFGHHSAVGFCPFSIEDYPLYKQGSSAPKLSAADLAQDDQLNAFSPSADGLSSLAAAYRLLRQAEPLIISKQGTRDIFGVHLDNDLREQTIDTPDGITLTVRHSYSLGWEPGAKQSPWPEVGCLIIRQSKEDYLVIGSGVVITYAKTSKSSAKRASANASSASTTAAPTPKDGERIGLAKCEVVEYRDGKPVILRHLSGDQTHQGRHVRIPVGQWQMQHFRLYTY